MIVLRATAFASKHCRRSTWTWFDLPRVNRLGSLEQACRDLTALIRTSALNEVPHDVTIDCISSIRMSATDCVRVDGWANDHSGGTTTSKSRSERFA